MFSLHVIVQDVLVSPLRPAKRFADLTPGEVSDLFLCVHKIAPVLQGMHGSSSLTIALQDGKDAGQTVEHVHVHILPRQQGDFARNDDIYTKVCVYSKLNIKDQPVFITSAFSLCMCMCMCMCAMECCVYTGGTAVFTTCMHTDSEMKCHRREGK